MLAQPTASNIAHRAERLMMAGAPALLASFLLFRADRLLFGMSSDLLAATVGTIGIVAFATGLVLALRSRLAGSRRAS